MIRVDRFLYLIFDAGKVNTKVYRVASKGPIVFASSSVFNEAFPQKLDLI